MDYAIANKGHWTNEDLSRLMSLWNQFGSVMLVAAIMGRPPSSVQTQASRRNLPKRANPAGPRRTWSREEDRTIRDLIDQGHRGEKVDILAAAASMGRSIDAVVGRMASAHGIDVRDFVAHLKIPTPDEIAASGVSGAPVELGEKRKCPLCMKWFVSADKKRWYVCSPCKEGDTWQSGM